METGIWLNGDRETTSIWHFNNTWFNSTGDCTEDWLSLADKRDAASSDNTVMIGATSAVAGFAVTMFALTWWGKAARAAKANDDFMRA